MVETLICLSITTTILAVSLIFVIHRADKRERDLLDRLMARDFTDYSVGSTTAPKKSLKRWCVSDEQAAKQEQERARMN